MDTATILPFAPTQFHICVASGAWELAGCAAVRRTVFCDEQRIFVGDDRDEIDAVAITLAALSCMAVLHEQVVGTVRIHEEHPGAWFGSRLAVQRAFRGGGSIGGELIRMAVGTAHARGARSFRAHVQAVRVALFERLHWRVLAPISLHGHPHALMQADLAHYPPHRAGNASLLWTAA